MLRDATPSAFPVAYCKRLSACLTCHHCVPNMEPWPGRKQLSRGQSGLRVARLAGQGISDSSQHRKVLSLSQMKVPRLCQNCGPYRSGCLGLGPNDIVNQIILVWFGLVFQGCPVQCRRFSGILQL